MEPWIADLVIILAAVLIERAFRAVVGGVPGGRASLALIIALTDLNASYLTDSSRPASSIEG